MPTINIDADNISDAWLRMVTAVDRCDQDVAFHASVHIAHPTIEDPDIRGSLDELLADLAQQPVQTVANTIFPSALAARSLNHSELASRYSTMYPVIKSRLPANNSGTYFGRLIAYPASCGEIDQIGAIIQHLEEERKKPGPKSARYEAAVAHPQDDEPTVLTSAEGVTEFAAPIYVPGTDNRIMGFPCLSACSFQLARDGRVHLLAHYRSQYLVRKGYGNYVGLGRLLHHVAHQAGLEVGQLSVIAGKAEVELALLKVRRLAQQFGFGS